MRLIALFFITIVPLTAAAEIHHLPAQKEFVNYLFNNGQYFHCISETRRLIELDPDKKRYNDYSYFILTNYYYGGQYLSVIENLSRGNTRRESPASGFIYAYSLYNAGYKKEAVESLYSFYYSAVNPGLRDDLMFRRVDLMLKNGQYRSALDEIVYAETHISPEKTEELKRAISGFQEIRFRSPAAAGVMSALIPGSGNIYAGSGIGSAVMTFLAVSLPAALSIHSFRTDSRKAGYTMAAFTAIFYAGGIYSARNTANRTNTRAQREFRQDIRERYIPEYDPQNYIDIRELLK